MAVETQGTRVYWSTSTAVSTSTTALVGSVLDFSGPGGEAADIDITTLASTSKEFMIGLRDEGNFTINVLRDTSNAAQTNLITDRANRTLRKLTIDFSTLVLNASVVGARITMDAYCKGFSISGSQDDVVKAAINFRITGPVDTTKATS